LLVDYYDPMYDYQLRSRSDLIVFRGDRAAVRDWLNI
jgi:tRNA 2-selenouridine synthase